MKKSELDSWAWYPFKRLTEGKGMIGTVIKRVEEWNPLERIGKPESRKLTPLATIRQRINGEMPPGSEEEKAREKEVQIPFEHLPKPIQNYAEKEAEKTGMDISEVVNSKPFRNYLLSRLK